MPLRMQTMKGDFIESLTPMDDRNAANDRISLQNQQKKPHIASDELLIQQSNSNEPMMIVG